MRRRSLRTVLSSIILLVALAAYNHHATATSAFVPAPVAVRETSRSSQSLFYAQHRPFPDEQTSRQAGNVETIRGCRDLAELRVMLATIGGGGDVDKANATLSTEQAVVVIHPNVAAAALRKIYQLVPRTTQNEDQSTMEHFEGLGEVLPFLLESIQTAMAGSGRDATSTTSAGMSIYALADALQALAILQNRNDSLENNQPLLEQVWERLQEDSLGTVSHLGPRRLVECLRAASSLVAGQGASSLESRGELHQLMCERLTKGDALSKLKPADLSTLLSCFSNKASSLSRHEEDLVRAVTRRFRKKAVRQAASITVISKCLGAATAFISAQDREASLGKEVRRMAFTLCKESIDRVAHDADASTPLSAHEAGRLLHLTTVLELEASDGLVENICGILADNSRSTLEYSTPFQLSRLLHSLERLNATNSTAAVTRIGEAFACYAEDSSIVHQIEPRNVNSILRCAALLHGRSETTMQPFQDGARTLLLNQAFLHRCTATELSNCLWFSLVSRWNDDEVVQALATRILETDVMESCSPKMACRTLSTLTAITSRRTFEAEERRPLQPLLFDLFDGFGEQLLSSQLTPLDISSVIFAYAKTSYIRDMGIFDHLVELVVSRIDEFNVRQVAQSLWACGKMMAWEIEPEDEEACVHPYLECATSMATFLADHADVLTTKDVAQSLWAIGRLQLCDPDVLTALSNRAKAVSKDLTAPEIANIFWALSKANSQDFGLIYVLMRRVSCDDSLGLLPQEAANILYALGRLNIRDDDVFKKLSNIILDQIELTSAQAIANVLWAHRAVHITPPQQLLDSWAIQKLGLVTVQPQITYE